MKRDKRVKGYHKILAWQRAHALVLQVYTLTAGFPRQEMFGLTGQMRDAAVSVAANIVEGYARGRPKQFLYHLNVSWGSLAEVEYYLELAEERHYITAEQYESAEALRRETAYLLHRLMQSVARRVEEEGASRTTYRQLKESAEVPYEVASALLDPSIPPFDPDLHRLTDPTDLSPTSAPSAPSGPSVPSVPSAPSGT
ncbi:MAG: four helix bundle protein, partial [Chloroflexi bacterium]|nr:four helix bundle protein [Chloroflexota bacterium]